MPRGAFYRWERMAGIWKARWRDMCLHQTTNSTKDKSVVGTKILQHDMLLKIYSKALFPHDELNYLVKDILSSDEEK